MIGIDQKPLSTLPWYQNVHDIISQKKTETITWRHKQVTTCWSLLVNSETMLVLQLCDHQPGRRSLNQGHRQSPVNVEGGVGTIWCSCKKWELAIAAMVLCCTSHISKRNEKQLWMLCPNPLVVWSCQAKVMWNWWVEGVQELKKTGPTPDTWFPHRCVTRSLHESSAKRWIQLAAARFTESRVTKWRAEQRVSQADSSSSFFFLHSRCPLDHRDSFCVSNIFNPYTY